MSDFLNRKPGRNNWQARLDIPARLRYAFNGKRVLVKSLGTANRGEAKRMAALVVARWRLQFAQAGAMDDPLREEAERWRAWIAETATGEPDDLTPTLLGERAEQIEEKHGEKAALLFYRMAQGQAVMIDAIAEKWLEWRQYPARSEYQHWRHLELLLKQHKEVGEVDRKSASKFVSEVITPGRDSDTINKVLSTYRQLWKWLKREQIVAGENPWSEQGPPKGAKVKGKRSSNGSNNRRPFTEEEAKAFLQALDEGVDRDVSMLVSVSGMRVEEACSVLRSDVTEGRGGVTWLQITDAKTEAGKRKVPVVDAKVRAMLHKRVTASHGKKSAPVFPELPVDRFGDRSKPLVKRLGRTLRGLGMTDPALVAGHSWRHRARTLMEAAGVAPWTADYLIGHARPGEGLGRYSRPSEEQLIKAVKAVPLPV